MVGRRTRPVFGSARSGPQGRLPLDRDLPCGTDLASVFEHLRQAPPGASVGRRRAAGPGLPPTR